jgi:hypothetical protein
MSVGAPSRAERKAAQRALLRASLPDLTVLRAGLTTVFAGKSARAQLTIIDRTPNEYASSFPSEIVTCRLGDSRELRLLVKVSAGQSHRSYGHRGDVAYEADVYRHVLHPLGSTAPRWHGSYVDPTTGERWLVIEYVEGALRIADCDRSPLAMRLAAGWSARFHSANENRVASGTLSFLTVYDADYYRQWAERTATLATGLHHRLRWLAPLCKRFGRSVEPLLGATTVIHGEYAPKNTLVVGERVCPVDWESAAIAPGEIDLASLTDGSWTPALVEECTLEYQRTRWPAGAPSGFRLRLELARLYWNFRWLGERADWTTGVKGAKRLTRLRTVAERLELI